MNKYKVNFVNQNKNIFVSQNELISYACEKAGFSLDFICGGKGICGKCKVKIEKNNIVTEVLACKTKITCDTKIYLNENDYISKINVLTDAKYNHKLKFLPKILKVYKSKEDIKPPYCGGYISGLSLYVYKKFSKFINESDFNGVTLIYCGEEVIDIQKGNTVDKLYGAAIDIGTTSVVVYMYDLNNGNCIKTYSGLNKQSVYGADVISRILYSSTYDGAIDELVAKINLTINSFFDEAQSEIVDFKENLYNIVMCGNSTMQHLFFGLSPNKLGESPFSSITTDYIICLGEEINLDCSDRCVVEFLPLLGGFVGADTVSVLLNIDEKELPILMIDLGTNGEIAVGNNNKFIVSSTACGPALEGGNIELGMRAEPGAIEKFSIVNGEVHIKTIGDIEPIGICGSGVVDIVAEMLKENLINAKGKIVTKEEFINSNGSKELAKRIVKTDRTNSFIVYDGSKKIYITQKDIRQIQLAKSAILSGCYALINKYGQNKDTLKEIILSGAFGSYINIENAVRIGLLPDVPIEKIKSIGNGAGNGVQMFMCSTEIKIKCDKIIKITEHYELATDETFMHEYVKNMNFKI